jgi:hypothetical protein
MATYVFHTNYSVMEAIEYSLKAGVDLKKEEITEGKVFRKFADWRREFVEKLPKLLR